MSSYITGMEFWFYHHASYPWDTSDFYAEFWSGESTGPSSILNSGLCTAVHYAPVTSDLYPDVPFWESETWGIVNTELSQGGWPSLLGDNTPNIADHSFYSDDFIVWEPWIVTGSTTSDFFIRLHETYSQTSMASATWAGIKGLWR